MLYTIRPLERVYGRPVSYTDIKQERMEDKEQPEYREVPLKNGRVYTRKNGEGYVVEGISSTDMGDYLRDGYAPGKPYQG
jgi:hypothetical protein